MLLKGLCLTETLHVSHWKRGWLSACYFWGRREELWLPVDHETRMTSLMAKRDNYALTVCSAVFWQGWHYGVLNSLCDSFWLLRLQNVLYLLVTLSLASQGRVFDVQNLTEPFGVAKNRCQARIHVLGRKLHETHVLKFSVQFEIAA